MLLREVGELGAGLLVGHWGVRTEKGEVVGKGKGCGACMGLLGSV